MRSKKLNKLIIYSVSSLIALWAFSGCKTAKLIEYSSTAGYEQNVSIMRTEMLIIKGDNEKISRDYAVASAVDYLQNGKKNYYLVIAPVLAGGTKPRLEDLLLQYDYPYIIQAQHGADIISNLDKISNEWDSLDMKYTGAVYSFFITTPQNPHPWYFENRVFEIVPYVKFNYNKTVKGAIAQLSLGNRIDEIISSTVDGKTVKTRVMFRDDSKFWIFDSSDEMRDFQNLLTKGLLDLREKGMDGYYKKPEVKQEVKQEVVEEKAVENKAKKPVKKRKR